MSEFSPKQDRIRALLEDRKLEALLLQRVSSFAWATCGAASYVNTATTNGEAALLMTPSGRYLVTNNIEATRLEQEERLAAQGWELRVVTWHERQDTVAELTQGLRLGADGPYPGATDLSSDLARLRAHLTPEEGMRFRALGRLCAEAMGSAARAIRPGQTEYQIAGLLAREAESRGVQAIVNLIAGGQPEVVKIPCMFQHLIAVPECNTAVDRLSFGPEACGQQNIAHRQSLPIGIGAVGAVNRTGPWGR